MDLYLNTNFKKSFYYRFPLVLKYLKAIKPASNIAKTIITIYSIFAIFSLNI